MTQHAEKATFQAQSVLASLPPPHVGLFEAAVAYLCGPHPGIASSPQEFPPASSCAGGTNLHRYVHWQRHSRTLSPFRAWTFLHRQRVGYPPASLRKPDRPIQIPGGQMRSPQAAVRNSV